MKTFIIEQDPENIVTTTVLANAIVAISEGVRKLQSSRIADRTLYLLIADAVPSYGRNQTVGVREVKAVLEGIASLEARHLKKQPSR